MHVGFAIQRLDEESATATLDSFERLGILEEEFGDGFALAARQAGVPQAGVPRETGQHGGGPQGRGSTAADRGDGTGGGVVMKYLDEFSNPELARRLLDRIHEATTRPWAIMEVCGGQTHSIIRHGIDQLLPDEIEMIHGPGCPVCVTPLEIIDKALEIAARPDVIFCSFGDMLRVPGSSADLFRIKSAGGDVRVVYSPLDALKLARENPDRQVVFFGIGFETTAPANAMTVYQAKRLGHRELLAAGLARAGAAGHRRDHGVAHLPGAGVPRRRPRVQRDGHARVPAAGGAVRGAHRRHRLRAAGHPGGHPPDRAAAGVRPARGRERLPARRARPRATRRRCAMLQDVFEVTDRAWRGIGEIPGSGWRLSAEVPRVRRRAAVRGRRRCTPRSRRSAGPGEVLQGLIKPHECAAFGQECTPRNPLGATMVSSEGACAAYYLYRRLELVEAGHA